MYISYFLGRGLVQLDRNFTRVWFDTILCDEMIEEENFYLEMFALHGF